MESIITEAKRQNVWIEPDEDENNRQTAMYLLTRIDLSRVIPNTTRKKRQRPLFQLSWSTLARDLHERT